ncbi:MAG: PEP/pyruvate-binding domain-containing protein [Candidatus Omnitrophica bacterium]|nr:PEP/pyruvate-binding domain-containing protein [Candidatus Omnitrophota bacterium]
MNQKILLDLIKKQNQVVFYQKPKFLFEGQPGGKYIGTSYFYNLLKENSKEIEKKFDREVFFICPKTLVIQTDLFKDFMDQNNLWDFSYYTNNDKQIKERFLKAEFNREQKKQFYRLMNFFDKPIVVRSSSIQEDAERASFAGIFYSIFLPKPNQIQISDIENAIKLIYASQYLKKAKEFYDRLNILAGDERMAIMIQEVAGMEHTTQQRLLYYPELSFVCFSFNEYATKMINPSDGFYRLSLGLGLGAVEMESQMSVSVNIGRPNPIIGLNSIKDIIKNSPKYFYALELSKKDLTIFNENEFVLKLPIEEIDPAILSRHATLYDEDFNPVFLKIQDSRRYSLYVDFKKSINYTKNGINSVIKFLMEMLRENFEKDVDFEGAIDIIEQKNQTIYIFYPLQARFQVRDERSRKEKLPEIEENKILLKGHGAGGKGEYLINYVVLVNQEIKGFYRYNNEIGLEISQINLELKEIGSKARYLLLTPGRFGTIDPSVGISADFSYISHAEAIVEVISSRNIPTGGTHFFEDVRSAGMAYLHTEQNGELVQKKFFSLATKIQKRKYCFVLEYEKPLKLEIDKESNYILYFQG